MIARLLNCLSPVAPTHTRRHTRRQAPVATEVLESRRVLSVSVWLDDGTLFLSGDDAPDNVGIREQDGYVYVSRPGEQDLYAPVSAVDQIVFAGRGGQDAVTNETSIPMAADGGAGDDMIVSGDGDDYLRGGSGQDVIIGSDGDDTILGGGGDDFIAGGQGNDSINGGGGNDQLFGEEGLDWLFGHSGADEIYGDGGNDTLKGGGGRDWLVGGDDDDRISGGGGHDSEHGGAGDDTLGGGNGNDTLRGGAGIDSINGGRGRNHEDFAGPDIPQRDTAAHELITPTATAAITQFYNLGLDVSKLADSVLRIVDLPGSSLAFTVHRSDGSSVVWVDDDASGQNWYIDGNPFESTEYLGFNGHMGIGQTTEAFYGVDLLTLLSHEFGHVIGLEQSFESWTIMSPGLTPGLRILPTAALRYQQSDAPRGPHLEHGFLDGILGRDLGDFMRGTLYGGSLSSAQAGLGRFFSQYDPGRSFRSRAAAAGFESLAWNPFIWGVWNVSPWSWIW